MARKASVKKPAKKAAKKTGKKPGRKARAPKATAATPGGVCLS